jgi:hypothetical protein
MDDRINQVKGDRKLSRRFTTIEGWREVGQGVYAATGRAVRTITIDPEYDLHAYHSNERNAIESLYSRALSRDSQTIHDLRTSSWNHDTPIRSLKSSGSENEDPFADLMVGNHKTSSTFGHQVEEPYHVFSKREKWTTVVIIGIAGMFSGLSSNIYFPALDAVAKVILTLRLSKLTFMSSSNANLFKGSACQLGFCLSHYNNLHDSTRNHPTDMGLLFGHPWEKTYLYLFFCTLHYRKYCVELFAKFCGLVSVSRFAGGRQCINSEHRLVSFNMSLIPLITLCTSGNGVIQDITPLSERGGFNGFYQGSKCELHKIWLLLLNMFSSKFFVSYWSSDWWYTFEFSGV